MLSGVWRGMAGASDVGMVAPGQWGAFPICHAGSGSESVPDHPYSSDCCDACALLAPAVAATPPVVIEPVALAQVVAIAVVVAPWPVMTRQRMPRQSQGPPAA